MLTFARDMLLSKSLESGVWLAWQVTVGVGGDAETLKLPHSLQVTPDWGPPVKQNGGLLKVFNPELTLEIFTPRDQTNSLARLGRESLSGERGDVLKHWELAIIHWPWVYLVRWAGKCDYGEANWLVFCTCHALGPLVPSCPKFPRPPRRPVRPVALKLGGHGLGGTNEPRLPKWSYIILYYIILILHILYIYVYQYALAKYMIIILYMCV